MIPLTYIRQKIQTFLNPPALPVKTQIQPGFVPIPITQISKQFRRYPITLTLALLLIASPLFSQIASGPAGVGNTDGSDGQPRLVMWLDATQMTQNTGHFATMPDYSGNLNHATTHNNNRPTFQNNTPKRVVFNHDNNNQSRFLTFNGNIITNSNYTFTFIGGRLSNNNLKVFVGGSAAANNQNLHLFFNTQNNTNNFHHHHWGNDYNGSLNSGSNTGGTAANSPGIFMALLDQNTGRRTYQNNIVIGQTTNTAPLGSWDDAAFARFTNHLGFTSYHDIFMSEAIVYSAALNPAQITILNNYLHHKYNIAINGMLFNTPVGYKQDIIGIGSFAGSKHTANFGRGGGLFIREANNSLTDGQYIFASHNNGTGSATTELPGGGQISNRSSRLWYIERVNGSTTQVTLGFKLDETGLNAPTGNEIFYLLYREGTTGNFTVNTDHISAVSDGMVWFSLNNDDLKNGYYTIGRSSQTGRTWYTTVSGNWDNPDIWSIVPPPGYENPAEETPSNSTTSNLDRVIITQGHNIVVTTNNKQNLNPHCRIFSILC